MARGDYTRFPKQGIKGRLPMTVIIAMRELPDSILIAADSLAVESGSIKLKPVQKIYSHPTNKLAWGCSGNQDIENDFSAWLLHHVLPDTWDTLKIRAMDVFSRLNGRQIMMADQAHSKADLTTNCLLVGWLDKPGIYELNSNGQVSSYWDQGFHAIGAGQGPAYAALRALDGYIENPLDKLKRTMEIVVNTVLICGNPCRIYRVTKDEKPSEVDKWDVRSGGLNE